MKSLFYPFWKKKTNKYGYGKQSARSRLWYLGNEVNNLRREFYSLNEKISKLAKVNGMVWGGTGFITKKRGPGRPKKQKPDFICR